MLEPKNKDAIASLSDHNNGAETIGTDHNNNGPGNVLELLCALSSDNALFGEQKTAARRVKVNDALNTCHGVTPYSGINGFMPSTKVATAHGWKCVSARACHLNGKSSDVIKARLAVIAKARDHVKIDMFRRSMVKNKQRWQSRMANAHCSRRTRCMHESMTLPLLARRRCRPESQTFESLTDSQNHHAARATRRVQALALHKVQSRCGT